MSEAFSSTEVRRGLIGWMTYNRITPNLIMLIFLIGGAILAFTIKQEVFPEFDLDIVTVRVPYPGSSPEEVEQGIILSIEEAIRGLDGIKEITAVASEGFGTVTAELLEGANQQKVYQDIKQEIDRITTFPEDAEEPEVSLLMRRREVLQIDLYGDVSEWVLRSVAEQVRDSLLQSPGITQVELDGVREYEVLVLINQETLRTYGLTLQSVAAKIRASAIELPGGYIETAGGDILLRVKERRDWAAEFARIPIITTAEGSILYLEDIAEVKDDFADTDQAAFFNGYRAIGIEVYRIGKQTPIGVSQAARAAMARIETQLPPGVHWAINRDDADVYRQRLELLLKNALCGLILVILLLGVFLEFKLAMWVTMGIPISFLGAFLFLPAMDVTINMISMFAFIIALGIVVDDAIVVGENIYEYRNRGMNYFQAAVLGARDVVMPVGFSIITNIIAFLPLYFIPGFIGKVWKVIPLVVITIFTISWIESTLILPSHLAHALPRSKNAVAVFLHSRQQAFSRQFEWFIRTIFGRFLDFCIRYRQITVAASIAVFLIILSYILSGRIGMILMPRVESDVSVVTAVLPFGSPMSKVKAVSDLLAQKAEGIIAENGGAFLSKGIYSSITENQAQVRIYLTEPEVRPISTSRLTQLWREAVGQIPGLESLRFESDRGGLGSGAALTVELSHRDITILDKASSELADLLSNFPNVKDIDDGYTPGKEQLNFKIKPEGQALGLTAQEIARQVRNAFYGAEALRQQRGRNEIRVRVKLPLAQRRSEYDIETLLIRTPSGKDVPLMQAAEVARGRSYTSIQRRNGRRTVTVTANVEPIDDTNQVKETLESKILPNLLKDYPGLSYAWEGRQQDLSEGMQSLNIGFLFALLGIYAMLAIPFRSYFQPIIVMIAIPFGIIGAIIGHLLMGYSLSMMSMMGIVALSGVVVNDSLVLIDYANRLRSSENLPAIEAIHQAGVRRFRPILLTTLTTFGGLAPMIFETSRQARFMIPMAISLGFGILFATGISLVLVPCLYIYLEDIKTIIKKFSNSFN
ncbi:MAG TPA: efflux RND transporter permease subunit [Anaerohalosphaeraceae bacterium]|nr:efflux RND transporter permease subunit [Anaerohalosphaeraceae bacterium]HOM76797.1 efflux RND transporter permease subunit [Anaerohalosphaeraceae bacterium]HPO70471.1 efflux RND transporter permease subunit [Anaerohalosphaeraceae bacterium]